MINEFQRFFDFVDSYYPHDPNRKPITLPFRKKGPARIYFIAHEDEPDIPVYVGKTENSLRRRFRSHLNHSKRSNCNMSIWIKEVIASGKKPIITLIELVPLEEWDLWEKYWIDQIKSWGFNLKNMREGGQGFGRKYCPINMKLAGEKISKKLKGRKLSPEHIANILKYRTGRPLSESTRKKISESQKGKVITEECKRKISKAKIGKQGKNNKPIKQVFEDGSFKIWRGAVEAAKFFNISRSNIVAVLKGRRPKSGGFKWEYL